MVMRKNMMRLNLFRSIRYSIGRYVAIAVIIALGAGMFVGLRSTRYDMVATGQSYTDAQNMFDLRLLTSYGWRRDQVEQVRLLENVSGAEGVFYQDLIVGSDEDGSDAVYRFYSIPQEMDMPVLLGGRMPERIDECLADGYRNNASVLGKQITVSESNEEDTLEKLRCRTFTIVGYVSTPLYMDMNRGNTSVGNGSIANYYYVPDGAFDVDYYTEIHVTIPGDYKIYTKTYNDALADAADVLKPLVQPLADDRLITLRVDALKEYADGRKEYQDGLAEYDDAEKEANQELHDAEQELRDGWDELRESEEKLTKGEKDIATAKYQLYLNKQKLVSNQRKLDRTKEDTYKKLDAAEKDLKKKRQEAQSNLQPLKDALSQINAAIAPLDSAIGSLEGSISAINDSIQKLQGKIDAANSAIESNNKKISNAEEIGLTESEIAALKQQNKDNESNISTWNGKIGEYKAQRAPLKEQLDNLDTQRAPIAAKKAEAEAAYNALVDGLAQLDAGLTEVKNQRGKANAEFASAQAQIKDGEQQLADAYDLIAWQERQIREGWDDLRKGKEDWQEGYQEFKDAKADAKKELADAKQELEDAAEKLADAKKTIDGMVKNEAIVLDRNSNMGYSSLDSSSNIVAGVSKVFPVFFLLVAALVCITTMTRMVDDERTQIGTLKALGYSNKAIISKYLLYAGSSAIVGCTVGVILGSIAFPVVLWEAYKIMIFVTPRITLKFDWLLCAEVVLTYTAAMLLVTWYCCREELKEVPAELIRPKAPAMGKQLILEKLPIWQKLSFLNKVALRNIFRYRQRFAMMMLGIGGCAGLLLTGFGFRDSIMNIVDIQFREVTKYDIGVYFNGDQSEEDQHNFREELKNCVEDVLFYSQSSVELDGNGQTKDIALITAGEKITEFFDFHKGSKALQYPGVGEMLLTSGMADMLGLKVGDQVVVRSTDLEIMHLLISGVYDNHVQNFAIISPETMEQQWGRLSEKQMAYVKMLEGQEAYAVGAEINAMDNVLNVTVNEEQAASVRKMMEALNLVVLIIVFCAGLLAAIVLYNLTNINITERIREIATIKVLGFNAGETAMYVFKENLVLSIMGSAFGMLLGQLLLRFVISQIKIDMIWLQPRLVIVSYILSVVLTLLMAVIVDFIFYFRLDKINMAEALKSVE